MLVEVITFLEKRKSANAYPNWHLSVTGQNRTDLLKRYFNVKQHERFPVCENYVFDSR